MPARELRNGRSGSFPGLASAATLGFGVGAFGLAGALLLRTKAERLVAASGAIIAFLAVVCVARWAARALGWLGAGQEEEEPDPLVGLVSLNPRRPEPNAGPACEAPGAARSQDGEVERPPAVLSGSRAGE